MPSTLFVIPRYRPQREAMRVYHAHRAGPVYRTCLQLRAQQRGTLQDNRSCLQGDNLIFTVKSDRFSKIRSD